MREQTVRGSCQPRRRARWSCALAALLLVVAACSDSQLGQPGLPPVAAPPAASMPPIPPAPVSTNGDGVHVVDAAPAVEELHRGDLPELRRRGVLRILRLGDGETYLPRAGSPLEISRGLAAELARDLGLEPLFVPVARFEDLIPALIEGRGDLVVENLTVTEERARRVAFSAPVAVAREQVVTRADDEALRGPADLAGRRVALRRSSSFWDSVQALRQRFPGIEIEEAPGSFDIDLMLDGVASGSLDVSVVDSNLMDAAQTWHEGLRVAFDLGSNRMIAWAMRREARELRKVVNGFLARAHPVRGRRDVYRDDLPELAEKRRSLRVLTRNSATTYFIWRGQLMGFEYDLAREFARRHGLRVELVVPPTREDLLPWLVAGKGDVVAAGLTATEERTAGGDVAFSVPTNYAQEVVVTRADDDTLGGLEDLSGRRFVVRRSSSYWQTLVALREQGARFELEAAPEELETEAIIARVASGEYDLTLADSLIVDVEQTWRDDVRTAFAVGPMRPQGWAVRQSDPALRAAIDAFFVEEYRGLFYNVTFNKYFRNPRKIREHAEDRASLRGRISPWDELARKYGQRHAFDWRLLVAQMHQESRFDPTARSFAGAQGLLQVLPRTARQLGVGAIDDPEDGLEAGVRYLAWVRERFERTLPQTERTWLALAAYNAGPGHVRDARRIAAQRGWDPNRWFDNVERAMLLKEQPEVHQNTRFGYARGREPVEYVRAIKRRYHAYMRVAPDLRPLASAEGP